MPGGRLLLPSAALITSLAGARLAAALETSRGPVVAWRRGGRRQRGAHRRPDPRERARLRSPDHAAAGQPGGAGAAYLGEHAPRGARIETRDAGVLAYFVGPDVAVDELHPCSPGPTPVAPIWTTSLPARPEFVTTLQGPRRGDGPHAGPRGRQHLTAPYTYLGRVFQHVGRFYDIYARADLGLALLPSAMVTNYAGPRLENRARAIDDALTRSLTRAGTSRGQLQSRSSMGHASIRP
ncbi:MAG: hypothetical protein U0P30_16220 [Vicinamibacterales bacterium]